MINTLEKIKNINKLEDKILDLKKYNPIMLGNYLTKLTTLRKDLYQTLDTQTIIDNNLNKVLQNEANDFYLFITRLLSTKKTACALYFEILGNSLKDYSFVKPFDSDRFAYRFALRAIDYLMIDLKLSQNKLSNYKLRGTKKILKHFIDNNKKEEKENIQ